MKNILSVPLEKCPTDHNHRRIWQNIKGSINHFFSSILQLEKKSFSFSIDLLKSCVDSHSKKSLFNDDGSLINLDYLRNKISLHDQSYTQRQKTWPYLFNIYSPTMNNTEKQIYRNQANIRYNKYDDLINFHRTGFSLI